MSKLAQRNLINWIIAIPLIFIGLFSLESDNVVLIAYLTLLVSIINFWNARKSVFHLIIYGFILFSNYSVCISLYINPIGGIYTSLVHTKYGSVSICILLVFNALLLLLNSDKSKNQDYSKKFISDDNYNDIIAFGALALTVLIFVFGFGRSGGKGERGEVSALYEYAVMLFLLGFMYSGRNKFLKAALLLMTGLYCVQDLIYGGRITSLQMIIMVYLVFFHDKKINLIKIVPLVLLGLLVFSAVGEMRGDFNFSVESLVNAFKSLLGGSFSLDTAYSAFYASQIFVRASFLDSWAVRLDNFGAFVLSIFGGGGENSNLSAYSKMYGWHGGGGLTPFYMYYYLGVAGVFVVAMYLVFLFKKFHWEKSHFSKAFMIYVAYTVPRWYLYSTVSIIRGLLIFILAYAVCSNFHKIMKKGKRTIRTY